MQEVEPEGHFRAELDADLEAERLQSDTDRVVFRQTSGDVVLTAKKCSLYCADDRWAQYELEDVYFSQKAVLSILFGATLPIIIDGCWFYWRRSKKSPVVLIHKPLIYIQTLPVRVDWLTVLVPKEQLLPCSPDELRLAWLSLGKLPQPQQL